MKKAAKTVKDERQMNIFALLKPDEAPAPGSMNISLRLRQSISAGIRHSGMDRIDICAEVYKLTGIEISKSTLDGWSAESRCISGDCIDSNGNKRWGIPAEVLAAFCVVTGYWEPLHIVVESGHHKALKGKDVVRARIGLLKEEITKKSHELKDLEKALLKIEGGVKSEEVTYVLGKFLLRGACGDYLHGGLRRVPHRHVGRTRAAEIRGERRWTLSV